MPEGKLLEEMCRKLDIMARLIASDVASRIRSNGGKQKDVIETLAASGLPNPVIADLIGTTTDTVGATLRKARKGSGRTQKPAEADSDTEPDPS
jgi:hypothetical protein